MYYVEKPGRLFLADVCLFSLCWSVNVTMCYIKCKAPHCYHTLGCFCNMTLCAATCLQDDIMYCNLTVEENLAFSARYRLPVHYTHAQHMYYVERALQVWRSANVNSYQLSVSTQQQSCPRSAPLLLFGVVHSTKRCIGLALRQTHRTSSAALTHYFLLSQKTIDTCALGLYIQ